MKKTSLMIAGFLMFAVFTYAQNAEKLVAANIVRIEQGAKFNWLTSQTINVGKIEQGTPVTVTFEFTNTGSAPLLISSAKGQCGCTSVEYSREAIAPNKKGIVKATYNAASAGAFNKGVTVYANVPEQQIQLNIKGEVSNL